MILLLSTHVHPHLYSLHSFHNLHQFLHAFRHRLVLVDSFDVLVDVRTQHVQLWCTHTRRAQLLCGGDVWLIDVSSFCLLILCCIAVSIVNLLL